MSALDVSTPEWKSEDVLILEEHAAKFIDKELVPHMEGWIDDGIVPRSAWEKSGEAGLLCPAISDEYGGAGGSFAHEAVLTHQLGLKGCDHFGIALHNSIVAPYIAHHGTEEQKSRLLPLMASGEYISAIAMTEPAAGSDLQGIKTVAKKEGNGYVLNGQKTFITNGQNANLIIVVAKTDPNAGAKGTSLFLVETDKVEGFRRGRNLDKVGYSGNDTSELFFDNVFVPADALLGTEEGQGFIQLMTELPQERLLIAVQAMARAERALTETLAYVKERNAFGKRILDFQNTQFKLSECKTEVTIGRVFVDHCIAEHLEGKLDAVKASMAKYWTTDLACKVIDECLQLHGGYGYMNEYPIAQMYKDARVERIYGGTNEIMKLLISRSL